MASILTLLAELALATAATAEVLVGQATSPGDEELPGDVDILSAAASYDSTTGTVTFTFNTREAFTSPFPLVLTGAGTIEPSWEPSSFSALHR